MNIQLNGEAMQTSALTLHALLVEVGLGGTAIATAINGDFVAQATRCERALVEGDRIEALAPMQGG